MRAIMVMFDSLNRKWLPGYGGDPKQYPNFARLLERTAVFDQSWVCSMPCMPARRDIHTGRPNFTQTGWGPLQPYDESMPKMLADNGTSTHLVTDHYHYFEAGGANYHTQYSSWQSFRGKAGDPWKGQVAPPQVPSNINTKGGPQDWVNRQFWRSEADWSQVQTFDAGIDFLQRNHGDDNWFLQIETFDPHEPFFAPESCRAMHPQAGEEPIFDWPAYGPVAQTEEEVGRIRDNYSALVTLCDRQLGRVLDFMDDQAMWRDTMLIVCTDHGFMLGEQGLFGKHFPTMWDEIGHTPFYLWDPRAPDCAGQRRSSLIQPAIDLAPTLLSFFGMTPTANMTGFDLAPAIATDESPRDVAIMGNFARPITVTDGRYCYVRTVQNPDTTYYRYSSMPTAMRGFWPKDDYMGVEVHPPLPFTNGIPVVRYPRQHSSPPDNGPCLLYDLVTDPGQTTPISDPQAETRLADAALAILKEAHTQPEYLHRFGW